MARLDLKTKKFVDKDGHKTPLVKRVLVPRSAGGYSPGWVLGLYSSYKENDMVQVILEEPSDLPDMVKHKFVRFGDLLPIEERLLV